MGKINWGKVIQGGLVAGLVMAIADSLWHGVIMKEQVDAAMQALGKTMTMTTGTMVYYIALDLLFGVGVVWVYALIRPRLGPGPRAAVMAGLVVWIFNCLFFALAWAPMGLFPTNLYVMMTAFALVIIPVAAVAGAKLYQEV